MFDDPVVILGKAELGQCVVERAARSDEQRGHVQAAAALRRVLLRHPISSASPRSILCGDRQARDQKYELLGAASKTPAASAILPQSWRTLFAILLGQRRLVPASR